LKWLQKGTVQVDRRLLIIDDDVNLLELLRTELESRRYVVVTETTPEAALHRLASDDFGVVLSDIKLRGMNGLDFCREVATVRSDTPVIVMTAFATIEAAVAAIRAGAYDFVTKPFDTNDLVLTIERALANRELRDEVKRLQRAVSELRPFDDIIGESAAMRKMFGLVARIADTDATVLVSGESGTGKELVARALHSRSGRSAAPFVAVNCAAMPESLLESELFGHTKGAFTDARMARPGLFVKASGGTLFLDEIGEMPLGMQAKLLRALQERTVRPVGSEVEVPFDARIVTATNRDLEAEVAARRFREDLFYRVNVVHVHIPPLRERENDALLLAHAFLHRCQSKGQERVVGIQSAAAERIISYPWPGNVRELQNCVERAVALAQFDHVGVEDLPERISKYRPMQLPTDGGTLTNIVPIDEVERRYVHSVLEALGGNKASAARLLGVDRRTLYRRLERWGSSFGPEAGESEP
jgi:two-component system response regulator HydG